MITRYRIFDLEAVVDPDMGPSQREFASPPWWRIICAASLLIERSEPGFAEEGEPSAWKVHRPAALVGADEARLIEAIIQGQSASNATLVTWGGRHYDVPVLVARAMKHRVPFRWLWDNRGARYRFSTEGTIDLCDELTDYGAADRTSLDGFARLIDAPTKTGNGSSVAEWWQAGELETIASYCFGDVRALGFVFARWMFVSGKITETDEASICAALAAAKPAIKTLATDERQVA